MEIIDDYIMRVAHAFENMSGEGMQVLTDAWYPHKFKTHRNVPGYIKHFEESNHIIIARGSRSPLVLQNLEDVSNGICPMRALGYPDTKSTKETIGEHFEIFSMIPKRDVAGARDAMTAHNRNSEELACAVTRTRLEQDRRKRTDGRNRPDHRRMIQPARSPRI